MPNAIGDFRAHDHLVRMGTLTNVLREELVVRSVAIIAVSLSLAACGGGGGGNAGGSANADPVQTNSAPTAAAGSDFSQDISSATINLDASSSSDPDNDTLSFSWNVVSEPDGASVSLNNSSSATPSFSSIVPGDYVFEVTVTDPLGSSATDSVMVTLVNQVPTISIAEFDTNFLIGDEVVVDASASTDSNGHDLTFNWRFTQSPQETAIPLNYSGPMQTIRFDVPGSYVLELEVSDGYDPATQSLTAFDVTVFEVKSLTNAFIDAEYDGTNRRIVSVAGTTLVIIDSDGAETTVSLPTDAVAVSIAPDGGTAVVAHDGSATLVDLNFGTVASTHNVPAQLGDIVLDANGYAYGFPETGSFVGIHVLDTATGVATERYRGGILDRTRAKLHPSGTKIYGASNGVHPTDLERYDIGGGDATKAYDSVYHGDFPFCGDLWIGPSGTSILSRCRVIVRATDTQSSDLTFVTQLDDSRSSIAHASSSEYDSAWYVIDGDSDEGGSQVKVYDAETGNPKETLNLPFIDDTSSQRWIGKFVFAENDSTTIRVLAVDDDANPRAYAVLDRADATFSVSNLPPKAVAQRFQTIRTSSSVTLDGSGSSDPEGAPLTYQWSLTAEPTGSVLNLGDASASRLTITPNMPGSYDFELIVSDGVRQSRVAKVTVNAFSQGESLVHRLQGDVIDAEFSKSLNAVAYLRGNELRLLDVANFAETAIDMGPQTHQVGLSPDGLFAAVSHAGMASLVDLNLRGVTNTQSYPYSWGDIVLDHNYRAHVIPGRGHAYMVSLDFGAKQSYLTSGAQGRTQMRVHPFEGWVYGADREVSPSDFEKWDVSSFPPNYVGQSPYHGDYEIGGNIWISEDGDRLLDVHRHIFHASSDASVDMTYAGALPDVVKISWADHSTERNEWAVATTVLDGIFPGQFDNMLVFYEDKAFTRIEALNFASIPTSNGPASATASHVFFSDDGSQVILLLKGEGLLEPYAIQVLDQ